MEFGVLTGSMETGNRLFAQMNKLAAQTPLEMEAITAAGKQLLSVGVPVEEITDKLRMLGDVAMGSPEKLDRLTSAFGQLRSKGTASMEQLNRFVEAGVPIMAELGKQTGKSGEEVFKLVSAGKIGFADVETALKNLTSEGGLYHDMMKQVAETAEGKFSTAMDNAKMALAEVGKEALPIVTGILDAFNKAMDARAQNKTFENIMKGESATVEELAGAMKSLDFQFKESEKGKRFAHKMTKEEYEKQKAYIEERIAREKNWQETLDWSAALKAKETEKAEAAAKKLAAAEKKRSEQAEQAKKDSEEYAAAVAKANAAMQALSDKSTEGWDRIDTAVTETDDGLKEYNAAVERARETSQSFSDSAMQGWDTMEPIVEKATNDIVFYTRNAEKMQAAIDLIKWPTPPLAQDFGPMPKGMAEAMEIAIVNTKRLTDETRELTDAEQARADAAMTGYQAMAEALGSALVSGEDGWKAFARAGLNAVAAIVEAMAFEADVLIAETIALIASGQVWKSAGLGAAISASVLAHGTAGAIRAIPMAEGGSGTVTKPTLFLAGEAGPESFAFGGANNKLMGGGGRSYSTTTVNNTVIQNIGGSVIAERQVKSLAMSGLAQASRGY
jgi:tape measure domain-containing protein